MARASRTRTGPPRGPSAPHSRPRTQPRNQTQSQTLRIIAGRWRGRTLRFAPVDGLRPTPDRVRETLFNWLQGRIVGTRCLDLFAGSGALGLEAASRGAAEVVLVDHSQRVVTTLRGHIDRLAGNPPRHRSAPETPVATDPSRAACAPLLRAVQADVPSFLRGPARPYDLVFLDPPYRRGALADCCPLLEHQGWLSADAWIYLEAESELTHLPLPANWDPIRSRKAGQVGYHLFQRHA